MKEDWEVYSELRKRSQVKKQENRANSVRFLDAKHIKYQIKNNGAHVIILGEELVDYWPGTGLWHTRVSKTKGRGIRPLLSHLQRKSRVHIDIEL